MRAEKRPRRTLRRKLLHDSGDGGERDRWLKQDVYDTAGNKIGEVEDLIVADNQSIQATIVLVGGFLGINEKHVAGPMNAIHRTKKTASGV